MLRKSPKFITKKIEKQTTPHKRKPRFRSQDQTLKLAIPILGSKRGKSTEKHINRKRRTTCTCAYPVANDRWGATDVATLSLHFILFSASLTAWQNFNTVHSAMLFSQRFFCRPLLLPPCTVPCKIVLASPDDLDKCPNRLPKEIACPFVIARRK